MGRGAGKRRWPLFVVLLLAAAGVAAAARRGDDKGKKLDPTLLVAVRRGDLAVEVVETGKVQPRERVEVKSKVAGQVDRVFVEAGDHVVKGQVLLRLDPIDYRREVSRTRADVMAAQNALRFAQLKLGRARRGFEQRGVAEIDVETADSEVRAKHAALLTARVACQAAQDRLRYTQIVAPMNGIVTERGIQPGEVVTPGVQATFEGKALLTVSDLSRLIVKADLNQIDIAKVELGQKVTVTLDALPGKTYSAVVTKIAPASVTPKGKDVDAFPVEATLEKVDGLIKPGMTADLRVHIQTRPAVLSLPLEAVTKDQGRRYVTRVLTSEKGQTTEQIEVTVGVRNDREVEIVSGLAAGEQVLIKPGSSAANEYSE